MPSPAWKKTAFARREQQVWFPGETVIVGIGQGYWTATLLQLAKATALLATRGQHFRPRLVRALVDPETGQVEEQHAGRRCRPSSSSTRRHWEIIVGRDGRGDQRPARHRARASAAAPPTRSPARPARRRCSRSARPRSTTRRTVAERLRDHALFVAFAPADEPEARVAVLVENGGFGGSAAAPIARAIFDAYLVKPDGQ